MCKTCGDRFNVQERVAAHDFHEQMAEYYGLTIKGFKVKRLSKKSLINKIEHQIQFMIYIDENKNIEFIEKLKKILNKPIEDLKKSNQEFHEIMQEFYSEIIKEANDEPKF